MNIDNITLEYLINPIHYGQYAKTPVVTANNKEQEENLIFYRKRILNITKQMLKGEFIDNSLHECFTAYANTIITYLQFIDKSDIIQEDYQNIESANPQNIKSVDDMSFADNMLIKKTTANNRTLDNFVNVVATTTESRIIPIKKTINIKEPYLRNKGIPCKKKKNVIL